MANDFNKEERVMFDSMLEKFDNTLVASRAALTVNTDQVMMERTNDIVWYPQPYIMPTYSGNDATVALGKDVAQLSVPASINMQRHGAFTLTARQLRDQQQSQRIGTGIIQKLANDIDIDITNGVGALGSIVVKRTVAATGFDDIALCESAMTEQGVGNDSRVYLANTRDYNNMAANLAKPATSSNSLTTSAFERALLPDIAGFNVYKTANSYRQAAAVAGTSPQITGANQYYTPVGSTLTVGRGNVNVDNRFQSITVTLAGAANFPVGTAFTIAGVYAVNHITKADTGQLKTFRIVSITSGGGTAGANVWVITPPIISAQGATGPELQYQNVTATPATTAAIVPLNTVSSLVNPFWQGDAVQIFPGRLAPAPNSGLATMTGTTDTGFGLLMTRQGEINTLTTKYRFDAIWGTLIAQPEMAGIELFSQT